MLNVSAQPSADMCEGCIEGCIHGAEPHCCRQEELPLHVRRASLVVVQLADADSG